ncbi:MAG: hypothetical protein LN588_00175 [Rickettsia endosymbiont of Bryobia graminum]|nr:hypothetical protein [Rickettsia endosymbiont of Bryobia graminum]
MDKKIVIWTSKGGCGKTNISAELILRLNYPSITNERESMLATILDKNRLLILKDNQNVPHIDCGVVFDYPADGSNLHLQVEKL